VDAANNLRDNMTSYHDVITTERWEMRFFAFFLGICEANAYASFRRFATVGSSMNHASFKDTLAFQMLAYCENLEATYSTQVQNNNRILRRDANHSYMSMSSGHSNKRRRLACGKCRETGFSGTRVEKSCSCNPDYPLCKNCHTEHLREVWSRQTHLNNSL
jgi:hypothetical protein